MDMEQMKAMGATLLRVFIAATLGQIIALGNGVLDFSGEQWRMVLAAGIAAVVVAAMRWVNPNDAAYGRGAEPGGSPAGVDVVTEDPFDWTDYDMDEEGADDPESGGEGVPQSDGPEALQGSDNG